MRMALILSQSGDCTAPFFFGGELTAKTAVWPSHYSLVRVAVLSVYRQLVSTWRREGRGGEALGHDRLPLSQGG